VEGGSRHDVATAGLLTKIHQNGHQNVIFDVISEAQKDLGDTSAGIGILKKSNT
jgi:hypothetical protein